MSNRYQRFKALTPEARKYYATIVDKDSSQAVVTLIEGGLRKLPIPTDLSVAAKVWVTVDYKGYTITSAPTWERKSSLKCDNSRFPLIMT